MDFLAINVAYEKIKKWATQSRCKYCGKAEDEEPSEKSRNGKECPLDTKELGTATWSVVHSMAAYYPDAPTHQQRCEIARFFDILSKHYPCSICAEDFRQDLKEMPPETESAESLSLWLCKLHNRVNLKIGKPLFDCNRVFERWRDGWKDGSCE